MFEKSWLAVPPQLFTVNGSPNGLVTIADTGGFKVKAQVVISATGYPNLTVECKRVLSKTQMYVGALNKSINDRSIDLTNYSIANGAFIYQDEQARNTIAAQDIVQAVYEQEPTVAIRTTWVDKYGNIHDESNPVPITFDGTIAVGNVTIQDDDGDELEINPDGSLNVIVLNGDASNVIKNTYAEASAVPAGVETIITQYTVSMGLTSALLQRISVCGNNVGRYRVFLNGTVIDTRRTYYGGSFNECFEFSTGVGDGATLAPGDIVAVKILHDRPFIGDFQARIQALEKI